MARRGQPGRAGLRRDPGDRCTHSGAARQSRPRAPARSAAAPVGLSRRPGRAGGGDRPCAVPAGRRGRRHARRDGVRQPAGPGRADPDHDAGPVPRRRPAAGVTAGRGCAAPGVPGQAGRAPGRRPLARAAGRDRAGARRGRAGPRGHRVRHRHRRAGAGRAGRTGQRGRRGELRRAAVARRRVRGGERGPTAGRPRRAGPGARALPAAAGAARRGHADRPGPGAGGRAGTGGGRGRPGDRVPGVGAGGRDLGGRGDGGQPACRGGPARLGRR